MSDDKAKWDSLTTKAREFVKELSTGNVQNAVGSLNDQMKQSLPGESIKQLWQNIEGQTGPYQGETGQARTAVEQGYDSVYLENKFEKVTLWVKVVFEGDKVAGLQVVPQAP